MTTRPRVNCALACNFIIILLSHQSNTLVDKMNFGRQVLTAIRPSYWSPKMCNGQMSSSIGGIELSSDGPITSPNNVTLSVCINFLNRSVMKTVHRTDFEKIVTLFNVKQAVNGNSKG